MVVVSTILSWPPSTVTVVEVTIIVDQETILLLGANITNGATTTMSVEIAAIILLDPKNIILTNPKIRNVKIQEYNLDQPKNKKCQESKI